MSDNGFQFGEDGLIDKRTMYEASIWVPLVVHCPDLFSGGQRRSEMLLNIDIAPTFLEAGRVSIPQTMHGRSFFLLLSGEATEWRDTFFCMSISGSERFRRLRRFWACEANAIS